MTIVLIYLTSVIFQCLIDGCGAPRVPLNEWYKQYFTIHSIYDQREDYDGSVLEVETFGLVTVRRFEPYDNCSLKSEKMMKKFFIFKHAFNMSAAAYIINRFSIGDGSCYKNVMANITTQRATYECVEESEKDPKHTSQIFYWQKAQPNGWVGYIKTKIGGLEYALTNPTCIPCDNVECHNVRSDPVILVLPINQTISQCQIWDLRDYNPIIH